jgi:hypothetical protein
MKNIAIASVLLLFSCPIMAATEQPVVTPGRYEIWFGISDWPSLGELQPLADGGFDTHGFGIGGAFHVPVKQFTGSELLFGMDAFVTGSSSNISGFIDDLTTRRLYLGASLKWAFGRARNLQLDGGLGYHLVDMAEVSAQYLGVEHVAWEAHRLGAFAGATWDIGAGRANRNSGLSLALKVHFVDFGSVRDEDVLFTPLLGGDAGKLDGPFYVLQIGYSSR